MLWLHGFLRISDCLMLCSIHPHIKGRGGPSLMKHEIKDTLISAKDYRIPLLKRLWKDAHKNWILYVMILLPAIYYLIFSYIPMYGVLLAFKNYRIRKGSGEVPGSGWNILSVFSAPIISEHCCGIRSPSAYTA